MKRLNDSYFSLGFSPDGSLLAARLNDRQHTGRLQLWDMKTGKLRATLGATGAWRFSPDGRFLLASENPGSIQIWDMLSMRATHSVVTGGKHFQPLAISPDGRILYHPLEGGRISLWELPTGEHIGDFRGHRSEVTCLRLRLNGTLFSASADGTILAWQSLPTNWTCITKKQMSRAELERMWSALQADASRAYAAVRAMLSSPSSSVPFLRERLLAKPKLEAAQVQKLIRELGDDSFRKRENAFNTLKAWEEGVEPWLREALSQKLSPETEKRLVSLIESASLYPLKHRRLQISRAIQALEWMNSAEALGCLKDLGNGGETFFQTREARAAVLRFGKRQAE
jgi:hypothetical protein